MTAAGPLRAVTEALVAGGVREVVICPGSRSTPMALALRAAPGLRTWVHLDERSAGFFALGASMAGRRPAAVLTTSGTAAVELMPAVVEARYGRVPLVVLSANRPPELQGMGAPQTIDQVELYGRHAKWFAALPVPDDDAATEAEARSIVAHAIDVAVAAPAGPVQLDLPFREPLLPAGPITTDAPSPSEFGASDADVPPSPGAELLEGLARAARASARPLIVSGPLDRAGFADALGRLAAALGAPVVADALANVRTGPHDRSAVIEHHDWLLRHDGTRSRLRPDLVLRFGSTPTSKALGAWLEELDAPQWLVDDGGGWNRPAGGRLRQVHADPVAFAVGGAEAVRRSSADPAWNAAWHSADEAAGAAIRAWRGTIDEPFEGDVPPALVEALPGETLVLVGNSMPVRDLDAFLPGASRALRFVGNRGANGVDGLLSTALGLAAAQVRPVVAVVGDLAFLHDVTALAAGRRLGLRLTIVLVDNDGGGIFSLLPQAAADDRGLGLPEHFEELFGTPHGLDLAAVASAFGARPRAVGPSDLAEALRERVARDGIDVLHLRTDRRRNAALHREAQAAVMRALGAAP